VAEIRVERKERRSLLPWILGLVMLALIVWGLMPGRNERIDDAGASAIGVAVPEQPPALRQYAMIPDRIFEDAA
jgi:hypothetical protein